MPKNSVDNCLGYGLVQNGIPRGNELNLYTVHLI